MVMDLEETVAGREGRESLVRLTLRPVEIFEDGVRASGGPDVRLSVRVTPDGRVSEVVAEGLPPAALAAIELDRLMAELKASLPAAPTGIGDSWRADFQVETDRSTVALEGRGRLERFGLEGGRRLAHVTIRRLGSVTARQQVGRAQVTLPGELTLAGEADIDLDRGIAYRSRSHSVSVFDLSAAGGGLAGTIRIDVRSSAELVEDR